MWHTTDQQSVACPAVFLFYREFHLCGIKNAPPESQGGGLENVAKTLPVKMFPFKKELIFQIHFL
jgi:hypothetical protein